MSMKKKNFWSAVLAMGLAATLSVGFVGCSDDDEPTPEIVENPLEKGGYYIAGFVTDGTNGLEGVTVKTDGVEATSGADGAYQLAVKKTGSYTVEFSKEGFVTVASATEIASGAKANAVVALSQDMTKANPAVTVGTNGMELVEALKEISTLSIPADALKEETDISITEYTPGAGQNSNQLSLSTLQCTPDGQVFEKPVVVSVKNGTSSDIYFADVKHLVEKNGTWEEVGDASYDAAKNAYVAELNHFSNHAFGPLCEISLGQVRENTVSTTVIDNLGKMDAVEQEITMKQRSGWEVNGSLEAQLSSAFSGLSSADISALATSLERSLVKIQGTTSTVRESTVSLGKAQVSGDMKMTIDFVETTRTSTISFGVFYRLKYVKASVEIVNYLGCTPRISYEYGASHPGHSGGAIQ